MGFRNVNDLIDKLSSEPGVVQTRRLTEFFVEARFKLSAANFNRQYVDGSNDGGIDFFHCEDNTYFLFQAKYCAKPKRVGSSSMIDEIKKIRRTIAIENPNSKADDFVNAVRRDFNNQEKTMEVLWLTTDIIDDSAEKEIQEYLDDWRRTEKLSMKFDFVIIDKNTLDTVIYDLKHGYIPYTGKRTLRLEGKQYFEYTSTTTGIHAAVFTANVKDIVSWFDDSHDIDRFLQKNLRGYEGETRINKRIKKSYLKDPTRFWYKHNGIIIFADSLVVDKANLQLIMRNPQIVNGGQTLRALFSAYDSNGRTDNAAEVLVRAYRLPYEHTETHRRSIEIISALNSQNKINPSDLHSTDPRQVRLEELLSAVGRGYTYYRKRSKGQKSGYTSIKMRDLAIRYYVCSRKAPHEGVAGHVEELFEEGTKKYDEVFNEDAINKDLTSDHPVLKYVTIWSIDQRLQKMKNQLPDHLKVHFKYTKWFVLSDIYEELMKWKQKKPAVAWQTWVDFIESTNFDSVITKYAPSAFAIATQIAPEAEEERSFYKSSKATKKYNSMVSSTRLRAAINKSFKSFSKSI